LYALTLWRALCPTLKAIGRSKRSRNLAFIECSETFCTTSFWASKYKALRGAFVAWRHLERKDRRLLQKNLQRLRGWIWEWKNGDADAYWKLQNLLSEMSANADD